VTWRSATVLQARQEQVQAALVVALDGVTDSMAGQPPVPGAASIAEVVAHLVLTERRVLDDLLVMLHEEHPELPSISLLDDPAQLREIIASTGTLTGLLAAFGDACRATLELVAALDEDQEQRSGHSPELGNLLLGTHALLNVRYHYPGHLDEIRAARRHLGLSDVELASTA
jgi:hypothetical protein